MRWGAKWTIATNAWEGATNRKKGEKQIFTWGSPDREDESPEHMTQKTRELSFMSSYKQQDLNSRILKIKGLGSGRAQRTTGS